MPEIPVGPLIPSSQKIQTLDVSYMRAGSILNNTPNVVTTFNTGVTPAGLALTLDGKFAYVTNNNNYGIPGSDSVTVLNLTTGLVETTITDSSFNQPYTATIDSSNTTAYITNSNTPTTSSINLSQTNSGLGYVAASSLPTTSSGIGTGLTITIVSVEPISGYITAYVVDNAGEGYLVGDTVTLSSDGNEEAEFVVTAIFPYGTITKIDISSNTVSGTIGPLLLPGSGGLDGPSGMVLNGTTAYINNYGGPSGVGSGNGHTVSVVNVNTNVLLDTIELGASPAAAPAAIAITPDGNFVYVANYVDGNIGTGTVSVIDTTDNSIVTVITGFSGPFAITITPNGLRAYVTNFGSNNFAPYGTSISIIDTVSNTIIKTIQVGIQPSGVAISPDGKYACISNYNTLYANGAPSFSSLTPGTGTMNIINTSTETLISPTVIVGNSPSSIVISPDSNFAYVSNFTSNTVSVVYIGGLP